MLTSAYAQEEEQTTPPTVPEQAAPNATTATSASTSSDDSIAEVIVTGSAIKRTDAETAVPLTVLKIDDLRAQGLTTVEQIVGTLSGNQTSQGTSQTVGLNTGGASLVDLRGIGADKTLILLNGRRIANSAFVASAADLNAIPMAAIERVEVLRDGASSLYGTDAIGGVINFITKKNYQGGTATLGFDGPEHKGGDTRNANIGFGYGDFQTQGFNISGFADFQKQNHVSGTDRDFNTRFPGGISKSTFPANYYQGDGSVIGNPDSPNCATGVFLLPDSATSCKMTTGSYVDYIPESQRASGFLHGDLKLGENHKLSAEYFVTRSEVKTLIAPVPYGFFAQNPTRPDGTPNPYFPGNAGNPFTPNIPIDPNYDGTAQGFGGALTGPAYNAGAIGCTGVNGCTLADLGLTSGNGAVNSELQPGFVFGNWRDVPNGPRGDDNITLQQRVVVSLDGTLGAWDYDAGLSYNHTRTDEHLISGYGSGDLIYEGILDGIINPYGAQDDAGAAYVDSALLKGKVLYGIGKVSTADARISNNNLGDWLNAGRQAAVAFGTEIRREQYLQAANTAYATQVYASTGIDPNLHNGGKRTIYAFYSELNVPLHETLDLTVAARYDHYGDFGSTTNPKVSLRWQPIRQLVVRSAFSTGFRAPSLYELHSAQTYTNTGNINDPVTCPDPNAPGVSDGAPDFCNDQFVALGGGNEKLKPEKSKTFTLGFVAEPVKNFSFGADYWFIRLKNLISYLDEQTLLDPKNQGFATAYIHRNPNGFLSDVTQICPGPACGYLDERNQNLGGVLTDGIDFNVAYRARTDFGRFDVGYNSTWVHRYNYQDYQTGPWNENVGVYVGAGPVFRWKHTVTLDWSAGMFSAGAAGYLKSGYVDVDPTIKVSRYATLDLYGGIEPIAGLKVLAGVRNVTDRKPPLSMQTQTFQSGYDPRYYDAMGRVFYVRTSYDF
jgi:iron complex outermembrane receptor protein